MTDEKKFEFNEDIENDCLMTWKNARTLGRYKALCNERDSVDVKKYDCFFAFGNESFARGMKGIRPLNDGEKIYSFCAGGYGTKDGIERLFKFYEDMEARIKNECDPQEVYFDGDIEAIRLVAGIWGVETAKTIKRRSAFYRVEELFN
nr:MAG: hypothetical protein [Bacteriophage sp.]